MNYPIDTIALAELAATAEPTRTQKCADLARAMGWRNPADFYPNSQWQDNYGFPPTVGMFPKTYQVKPMPNPYESAEDSRALVEWLAQDNARWRRFYDVFAEALRRKRAPDGAADDPRHPAA